MTKSKLLRILEMARLVRQKIKNKAGTKRGQTLYQGDTITVKRGGQYQDQRGDLQRDFHVHCKDGTKYYIRHRYARSIRGQLGSSKITRGRPKLEITVRTQYSWDKRPDAGGSHIHMVRNHPEVLSVPELKIPKNTNN